MIVMILLMSEHKNNYMLSKIVMETISLEFKMNTKLYGIFKYKSKKLGLRLREEYAMLS